MATMAHLAAIHPQASMGEETIWTSGITCMVPGHLGPGAPRGPMRQAPNPMGYKVSSGSTCYLAGSFTKHFLKLLRYSGPYAK